MGKMATFTQTFTSQKLEASLATVQTAQDVQPTDVFVLTFSDSVSRQPIDAVAWLNPSLDGDNYTAVALVIANYKQSTGEISLTSPVLMPAGTLVQVTYQASQ
jgi:hypothetical protein